MPGVRAKFVVQKIERSKYGWGENAKEMQTIVLSPVMSQQEGTENKKFWDASPSGSINLGTVNLEAGSYFELGGEYYIDFTKAEAEQKAAA